MALIVTLIGVAAALAAQGALVLFLLNLGPLGLDRGEPVALGVALLINVSLLLGFGGIHSLMARPGFKAWWTRLVSQRAERGIYLLVSGITLAAVLHLWSPLPAPVWTVNPELLRFALYGVFAVGLLIVFWAIFAIDVLHFHGLRQATADAQADPPFSAGGPYRFVRHPIQTGLIVALWATPDMTVGHLLFAAGMTAYSVAATLALEERDLRRSLGDTYRNYAKRVPALVPRIGSAKASDQHDDGK